MNVRMLRVWLAIVATVASVVLATSQAPALAISPTTASGRATTLGPSAPGRLAYSTADSTQPDGNDTSIHGVGTIGLDGTDQRVLTAPDNSNCIGNNDMAPQWSPDGLWLIYTQNRTSPNCTSPTSQSVVVIPRDGGTPQVLDPSGLLPTWSPDGLHAAWLRTASDGTQSIVIATVVDTATSVTVINSQDFAPPHPSDGISELRFSPDGTSLAFSEFDDQGQGVLYAMTLVGVTTQLTHGLHVNLGYQSFSWSPDGTRLLAIASPMAPTDPQGQRMYAYAIDRAGLTQQRLWGGSADSAAWNPAGGFAVNTGGSLPGIAIFGPDGSYQRSVGGQGRFDSTEGLAFSPDGSRVYTVAWTRHSSDHWSTDLYAIPINGDPIQRLTTDHGVFLTTVTAVDPGRVIRQFGVGGPVDTAAQAVLDNVSAAATVIIADVKERATALAANSISNFVHGPVLLTGTAGLPSSTRAAIKQLHASKAIVVGAVPIRAVDDLRAMNLDVSRIANTKSAFQAAAAIARRENRRRAVLVPTADDQRHDWQLPLAAAGFAAFRSLPLLYTGHQQLPRATVKAIRSLHITSVTLVGDDSTVASSIIAQLQHLGVSISRLNTHNRYRASAALAARMRSHGARLAHPVIASGVDCTSSLAAPAIAALTGQVSVLVPDVQEREPAATTDWLDDNKGQVDTADLVGGIDAVSAGAEAQLEALI